MSNKLILGTAQFGSDYGIKHDGQPSLKEIEKIAQIAWDGGIRVIHTSWQYNLSEECRNVFSAFSWIYKKQQNPNEFIIGSWDNQWVGLKDGISVYEMNDLELLRCYDYDVIQIPINVLDNRFLKQARQGFSDYEPNGLREIHARSVFLQGLLLMDILPDWLNHTEAWSMINAFQLTCQTDGQRYYEAALGYVLGLDEIDKVIVGVNSAKQLEELLQVKPLKWDYDFSIIDENVLDPRRWPKE